MKMKAISLAKAAKVMDGTLIGGGEDLLIGQVLMDSRLDVRGALFLAIAGARVDGHDFVAQVLERGAVCALVEREITDANGPQILVENTQIAVKKLAAYYRSLFGIPVIGITGSVGKTSTKEMVATVLSEKFLTHKTVGNLNNELGVPLTLLALREEHEAAVIEMGISDFGEMTRLTEMVQPTIAMITIIGYAHLDNLGDRNGVFRAKTEIFHGIASGGMALLNGDDDLLAPCVLTDISPQKTDVIKALYGTGEQNAYRAMDMQNAADGGTNCTFVWGNVQQEVHIPVFGTPMVYASLAAAAVGDRLGMTPEDIARGIANFESVKGRANLIKTANNTIIDDCYNANPSSMQAAIGSLTEFSGRKIAILGDMGELGPEEKALHYQLGEFAGNQAIDALYCVGDLSKHIADAAKSVNTTLDVQHFATKADLIAVLGEKIKMGDTVLVKASNYMGFSEIVECLQK